jgi:hypothetical protein
MSDQFDPAAPFARLNASRIGVTGASQRTTLVGAELAELEPDAFVPVTTATSVKPTSLEATVYEDEVAPPIGVQF